MQEQLVWQAGCLSEIGEQQGAPEPHNVSDESGGGLWVANEVGPLEGQV